VGGWLFEVLGHVPLQGEQTVYGNLTIQVVECDERKIRLVRVSPIAPAHGVEENG
jgi:CBS domain containing-hemolysin-like protein